MFLDRFDMNNNYVELKKYILKILKQNFLNYIETDAVYYNC